jgi:cytochrome c551/c552
VRQIKPRGGLGRAQALRFGGVGVDHGAAFSALARLDLPHPGAPGLRDTARMKTKVLAIGLALLIVLPAQAADGGALAADHGCLNCHGVSSHPHEAPLLKDLAAKLGRRSDVDAAANHALEEMREKASVHAHRLISDESALAILRWMAQGAKTR